VVPVCRQVPPAGHREDFRRADQPHPEAGHPQGTHLGLRGVRLDVELHADRLGRRAKKLCEFLLGIRPANRVVAGRPHSHGSRGLHDSEATASECTVGPEGSEIG
jgi:hypothetical protein